MENRCMFSIRNLEVRYDTKIVLKVPALDIPRGKMVFLMGNSGSGKTTFLETLGLMSDYYGKHDQIVFYPSFNGGGIDYSTIREDEKLMAWIRREHFTFMFQETHLFQHFGILENAALTPLIKNIPAEAARQQARAKFESIQIGELVGRRITEISGGEKQRVAFARAALAGGTVMFADEPTGNLGDEDAELIMKDIQGFVHRSDGKSTAIVVTHNLKLALQYGDVLIVVQDNHLILNRNVFERSAAGGGWEGLGESPEKQIKSLLKGAHALEAESSVENVDHIEARLDFHSFKGRHFNHFFGPSCLQELSIRKWYNLVLVFVILVAFLAIGFSSGSLNVLRERVSDPFINWITAEITADNSQQASLARVISHFKEDSVKRVYDVRELHPFNRFPINIYNNHLRGTVPIYGMATDYNDPIFKDILSHENLVNGESFKSAGDIGLILSMQSLEQAGLGVDDKWIDSPFLTAKRRFRSPCRYERSFRVYPQGTSSLLLHTLKTRETERIMNSLLC